MRPIDLAYEDVKDMLAGLVSMFKARYGGWEFDDMMGEAGLAFMKAFQTYERGHGAEFLTWVRYRTWHALLKAMDHRMRECRRERQEVERLERRNRRDFNFSDFLEGLSEDAQELVKLAVLPPLDLKLSLIRRGNRDNPTARSLRSALREILKDRGWPPRYVDKVFEEIQDAL